jgi:hypothetical protein
VISSSKPLPPVTTANTKALKPRKAVLRIFTTRAKMKSFYALKDFNKREWEAKEVLELCLWNF